MVKPAGLEHDLALSGSKALTHGLAILRVLVEAPGPMTATEIARRVGLHQSSASRILKTLAAAGYVRKPGYHSFGVDFGILTLGGSAIRQFPLVEKPRSAVRALAEKSSGLMVSLAALWHGEVIYFLRAQHGHELTVLSAGGYPLHLSSPALRLLLEWPEREALAVLRESRRLHGWERPTERIPQTAEACLRKARELLRHGCLVLNGWQGPRRLSASILVEVDGLPQAALALSGPGGPLSVETVLVLLQEGRRDVEQSLQKDA